uniref:Secreted protein n=1 Tax=Achlya hypogyna TaxID=1202772 RepID=A0A0A7CM30_ACHHY|nr:secreted protein [Achlya hypogyna]
MKLVIVPALLAAAHATHASEVSVWGQCGGKQYNGDKSCEAGSYCKFINEWYSQCQPGGPNEVGIWGQCGGNGYTGPTKCASGSTCKSWNSYYSQCVEAKNTDNGLPKGWLELPGFKWTLLDNDSGFTDAQSFVDCVKSADTKASDGSTRFFAVWENSRCRVASTVYKYDMVPGVTSAAKYNADTYECTANSDYYGDDVSSTNTRFNRCLDTCDNLAMQNKCNAVTWVRNPGEEYGACFIKLRKDTAAVPVANSHGGIACKRK